MLLGSANGLEVDCALLLVFRNGLVDAPVLCVLTEVDVPLLAMSEVLLLLPGLCEGAASSSSYAGGGSSGIGRSAAGSGIVSRERGHGRKGTSPLTRDSANGSEDGCGLRQSRTTTNVRDWNEHDTASQDQAKPPCAKRNST